MGRPDNTVIIYIDGDNGTSPEGTLSGTPNQYTSYNGILDFPVAEQLKFYDAWGSAGTYPHMAVAWSWAFDTPFKYTKQIASHFGGTCQGMAISWPNRIKDTGGVRHRRCCSGRRSTRPLPWVWRALAAPRYWRWPWSAGWRAVTSMAARREVWSPR